MEMERIIIYEKIDFNKAWTFYKKGSVEKQMVDLPHDAMIHENRDAY